jgi:hypothetical protein
MSIRGGAYLFGPTYCHKPIRPIKINGGNTSETYLVIFELMKFCQN